MKTPQEKYNIVRFFSKEGKKSKIIKTGLSLMQAQKHCEDPTTRKEGVWFDGYQKA